MSRSNYSEDCDSNYIYLYRGMVERAIKGKRSQQFLKELAAALDTMPFKRLIADELVTNAGEVCAIGAVCKARGLDTKDIDVYDPETVGKLVGISRSVAAEIEYENDEISCSQTPEQRWTRMRKWVGEQIGE